MLPALRIGLPFFVAALTMVSVASAEENCPVGSTEKKENGLTWCEPTVCETEAQCATGMLCRPISLCVEIGTVGAGDAGNRLMVRQRCGENKSCPQNTSCLSSGRCVTPTQAASLPAASSSATPMAPDAPKKSACGCDVVGSSSSPLTAALAALALVTATVARRRKPSR